MNYNDFKDVRGQSTFTINGITYNTMLDETDYDANVQGVILQEQGLREWSYMVMFDLDTNEVVSVDTSEVLDVEQVYP